MVPSSQTTTELNTALKGHKDRYNGFTIDLTDQRNRLITSSEPTTEEFGTILAQDIEACRKHGIRGLWIKVPLSLGYLFSVLHEYGFSFHHAKKDFAMLNLWLPTDKPNTLPEYATHCIGVGGFVVNDQGQVLVVCEKYRISEEPHWKLPGGMGDRAEDLHETAMREVLEETGVQTEFLSILCFRHMHTYAFDTSDIYFVALLRAKTKEIVRCEREIAAAKWMDIGEYANHPSVNLTNRKIAQMAIEVLEYKGAGPRPHIVPEPTTSYFGTGTHLVYRAAPAKHTYSDEEREHRKVTQQDVNNWRANGSKKIT
eukprot:Clim_evm33s2 gene=Clim_evmTU33s2